MRVIRGKDRNWRVKKFLGDGAYYAYCKCGFWFPCYRLTDTFRVELNPSSMYHYCPNCGARKKWYNEVPEQVNDYQKR